MSNIIISRVEKDGILAAAGKVVKGLLGKKKEAEGPGRVIVKLSNVRVYEGHVRAGDETDEGIPWLKELLEFVDVEYDAEEVVKKTGGLIRGVVRDLAAGRREGEEREGVLKKVVEGLMKRAQTGISWVSSEDGAVVGQDSVSDDEDGCDGGNGILSGED
jgi:hypothetical protein